MITSRWVAITLALAAVTLVSAARAGDPAAAEALFRQGRALARDGKWQAACDKFKESQRLDPAAGTLLNVAHCEAALGLLATAWEHYRAVLDDLPREDERVAHVRSQLASLEPRLPRLTIVLAPSAHDAQVSRDGSTMGRAALGAPLPVDPGDHVIVVTAPGTEPHRYTIALAEGEAKTVNVEPGPATRSEASSPPPSTPAPTAHELAAPAPEQNPAGTRTWGYVVGGVGVAGVLLGVAAGGVALSKKNTVRNHCDADYNCDASGVDAASSGKRWATVSTLGFVLGAVGVGAGAYLILSDDSRSRTAVGAVLSDKDAMAVVRGRF